MSPPRPPSAALDALSRLLQDRLRRALWLREQHRGELNPAGYRLLNHVVLATLRDLRAVALSRRGGPRWAAGPTGWAPVADPPEPG